MHSVRYDKLGSILSQVGSGVKKIPLGHLSDNVSYT